MIRLFARFTPPRGDTFPTPKQISERLANAGIASRFAAHLDSRNTIDLRFYEYETIPGFTEDIEAQIAAALRPLGLGLYDFVWESLASTPRAVKNALSLFFADQGQLPIVVSTDPRGNVMVLSVSDHIAKTFREGYDAAIAQISKQFPEARALAPTFDTLENFATSSNAHIPPSITAIIGTLEPHHQRALTAFIASLQSGPQAKEAER